MAQTAYNFEPCGAEQKPARITVHLLRETGRYDYTAWIGQNYNYIKL